MEFSRQSIYNEEDHNHFVKPGQMLNDRLSQLSEINKDWQCEERRTQIRKEMCIIAFELSERFRETKSIEIDEAWANHGE